MKQITVNNTISLFQVTGQPCMSNLFSQTPLRMVERDINKTWAKIKADVEGGSTPESLRSGDTLRLVEGRNLIAEFIVP